MFFDETSHLLERHDTRHDRHGSGSTSKHAVSNRKHDSTYAFHTDLAHVSIDDFALAYCYDHHFVHMPNSSFRLNLSDDKLLACMRALGAASFSTTIHSSELAARARQYYVSSIQLLNAALASPAESIQDSTLLTVIALSYYESISGNDSRSLEAQSRHVEGMAALVELRGLEQLQTPEGRLLLHQATSCLMSECMRTSIRLPETIHDLNKALSSRIEDVYDPPWLIQKAIIHLTDVKSDLCNGRIEDSPTVVDRFLQVDEELRAAFSHGSSAWNFKVVPSNNRKTVDPCLPGHIHLYKSSISAQLWNTMRNGRIACHAYVVSALAQRPRDDSVEKTQTQTQTSRSIMRQLQTDILASIPQHLGLDGASPYEVEVPGFQSDTLVCPSLDMFHVASASSVLPVLRTPIDYLLLWNLVTAGKVAESGSPLRKAVREILVYAGGKLGMSQAFVFADALGEHHMASSALGFKLTCLQGDEV